MWTLCRAGIRAFSRQEEGANAPPMRTGPVMNETRQIVKPTCGSPNRGTGLGGQSRRRGFILRNNHFTRNGAAKSTSSPVRLQWLEGFNKNIDDTRKNDIPARCRLS